MLSVIIFLFVLGLLIIVHEFGHFIVAKKSGVKVEKFSLGFGPKLFFWKRKDTEYKLSAIPLGGYVKLAGDNLEEFKSKPDDFLSKSLFIRFKVIFAGSLMNYIMGILCLWLIFFVGYPSLTAKVGALLDDYGAKGAGIQVGDQIIRVDDKSVFNWEDLQKAILNRKAKSQVEVLALRDGKEYKVSVEIKEKSFTDIIGRERSVGLIGITPSDEIMKVRHGFIQSFFLSIEKAVQLTIFTYQALWNMVTGKLSFKESMTGPLGMFYITSKAFSVGWVALIHFIAILNINLAIFNLLPLPALDGGHIVLLGLERLRGKYLSLKAERIFSQLGFSLIIFLAVFVFYNDLIRFGVIEKVSKWFR